MRKMFFPFPSLLLFSLRLTHEQACKKQESHEEKGKKLRIASVIIS